MSWLPLIIIVLMAGIVFLAIRYGKKDERADKAREVINDVKKANKAASEVDRMPDGDVIKRLFDKWGR